MDRLRNKCLNVALDAVPHPVPTPHAKPRNAIRLKPDSADAFANRGVARRAKGDVAGAIEDYNEVARYQFIASSINVRTATPEGPLAM